MNSHSHLKIDKKNHDIILSEWEKERIGSKV